MRSLDALKGSLLSDCRGAALALYAQGVSSLPTTLSTQTSPELDSLLAQFPFLPDCAISPIRGGRAAAEAALAAIDPAAYTRSRNFIDGAVSRLSPYLRHGVLSLAEVRDFALAKVRQQADADKFINELAWRDYWQRLYVVLGEAVWKDREGYKTGLKQQAYAQELPAALIEGKTGLRCMDSFSHDLRTTGYLHNHARMWMAAYVVHWLQVRWQAGARWFLEHLLDGDPASNNLSWQWVASTFSAKPYFFNRENLERYTNGMYCRECPLRGACPLEGSYEELEARLFHKSGAPDSSMASPALREDRKPAAMPAALERPLLWVHTDALNPKAELFTSYPQSPACFVWDEQWLRTAKISSKRVVFLLECLAELPARVEKRKGDVAAQLLAAAKKAGADHLVAMRTPDPSLLAAAAVLEQSLPVLWLEEPRFVDESRNYELKRFSRYWQKAQTSALKPTAKRA